MNRDALIHRVNPYLLHGEQYYEIAYAYANEPDALRQCRVAQTNVYTNPQTGDEVVIQDIFNVITDIKKKQD
jgi:hypothetical protein